MKRRKEESFLFATRVFLDFVSFSLSLCAQFAYLDRQMTRATIVERLSRIRHHLPFFFLPSRRRYLILFGIYRINGEEVRGA